MVSGKISVTDSISLGVKVYTLLAELLAQQEGTEITKCVISPVGTVNQTEFPLENGSHALRVKEVA